MTLALSPKDMTSNNFYSLALSVWYYGAQAAWSQQFIDHGKWANKEGAHLFFEVHPFTEWYT
jgi:hypothetical protein